MSESWREEMERDREWRRQIADICANPICTNTALGGPFRHGDSFYVRMSENVEFFTPSDFEALLIERMEHDA